MLWKFKVTQVQRKCVCLKLGSCTLPLPSPLPFSDSLLGWPVALPTTVDSVFVSVKRSSGVYRLQLIADCSSDYTGPFLYYRRHQHRRGQTTSLAFSYLGKLLTDHRLFPRIKSGDDWDGKKAPVPRRIFGSTSTPSLEQNHRSCCCCWFATKTASSRLIECPRRSLSLWRINWMDATPNETSLVRVVTVTFQDVIRSPLLFQYHSVYCPSLFRQP